MKVLYRLWVPTAVSGLVLVLACANPLEVSVVTLDLDGSVVVSPMEQEAFNVSAVNRGDERVVWGSGSSSCQLRLVVLDNSGRRHDIDFRACTDDWVEHRLDPGESITETFLWGGQIMVDQEMEALPSGEYRLIGVAGERESPPLTVRVLIP
jgi:hypothetical protein